MTFNSPLVVSLVASVLLVGCGGSKAGPAPASAAAPKDTKAAAGSADAGTTNDAASQFVYAYNPISKRDPFRNLATTGTQNPVGPGPELCGEPLCQADVDSFKLVAVLSGDANPMAMFEDGAGIGYFAYRNSKIGLHGGRITQITRGCVQITEYFQTPDGKINPNRADVCIKEDSKQSTAVDLLKQGEEEE